MKTCLIVGGGVTGLSAAVYAAKQGYQVTVLERHEVPGGVCTAWDRGAYTFDVCIHWLMGAREGDHMSSLYQEIGALDQVELSPIETFSRAIDVQTGTELALSPDLDALVAQVRAISPGDVPAFEQVVDAARGFATVDLAPGAPDSLAESAHQLWEMRGFPLLFARWHLSSGEWAKRLIHPGLRDAFGGFGDGEFPMAVLILQLGQLAGGHLFGVRSKEGFMAGPSRAFAAGIAVKARSLGARLRLGVEVEEILVENDRAVGVRLADGEELRGDHVISTAPLHTTVFRLLGGRYMDRTLEHRFARWRLFPPIAVVNVGCTRTWDVADGATALRNLPEFRVLGRPTTRLGVRTFGFDPRLAPAGHSVVQAIVEADFDAWTELHHTPRAYHRAKDELGASVLGALETRWPGISASVGELDVATPYTFWRYTRAWRGSYEGWWPGNEAMLARFDRRLPGLAGMHLAGQWLAAGGGLPPAVTQGRDVVRDLLHDDGRS